MQIKYSAHMAGKTFYILFTITKNTGEELLVKSQPLFQTRSRAITWANALVRDFKEWVRMNLSDTIIGEQFMEAINQQKYY